MFQIQKALNDVTDGFMMYRTWAYIAYQDVISRYRRSLLGPFWMSAGMVSQSIALALVFSTVYRMELADFLPLVIGGFTVFFLIGVPFTEAPELFLSAAGTIKAYPLPFSFHAFRMITRNVIIFGHNLVVFLAVKLLFTGNFFMNPEVIAGLFIVMIFICSMSLTMGIVGARFKDVRLLVPYVWTIIFYLTPVIWSVKLIKPENKFIFQLNPFYYLLEVIRTPLQGGQLSPDIIGIALMLATGSAVLSILTLAMFRKQIALWV